MVSRSELATRLARNGASHAQAAHAVDAVLHEITAALAAGERVALTGFGTFEPVARPERTARNPRTGAAVQVPAATVARFRAGAALRGALQAGDAGAAPGGSLPATGAAVALSAMPAAEDGGEARTVDEATSSRRPRKGVAGATRSKAAPKVKAVKASKKVKGGKAGVGKKAVKPAKGPGTGKASAGSGKGAGSKKSKGKH